jgi:hypothetical protein
VVEMVGVEVGVVGVVISVEVCGKSSFGWRHWLNHLGDIVRVVLDLGTRWASNVGTQKLKVIKPRT